MSYDLMILVCHDTNGHFNDGNRRAIQGVLNTAGYIATVQPHGIARWLVTCKDGGCMVLYAPGLDTTHAFHRMVLHCGKGRWTPDVLHLVFDIMHKGGFGLMTSVHVPHLIVTQPQQITYFPWLPQPPLLVRTPHDLAQALA